MITSLATEEMAIRRLTEHYSDAVTRRDFDTVGASWVEDGTWTLLEPYDVSLQGKVQILEHLRGLLSGMQFFVQMPHAPIIVISGDHAEARWTMHEVGKLTGSNVGHQNIGTYEDLLFRSGDSWRFVRRTYTWIYLDESALPGKTFSAAGSSS